MSTYILSLLILLVVGIQKLSSQKPEPFVTSSKGIDIGINVTSVLTSFAGSNTILNTEDLPIFFRFTREKSAFRIGLGAKGSTSSFFDNITFVERQSRQQNYFAKLGIEVHEPIDNRWQFYYGIDAVGSLVKGRVDIGSLSTVISQQIIGFGASPFLGIRYFIGERFYLSTEATMTYMYRIFEAKDLNGQPGSVPTNNQASDFTISSPIHLYVNYRLK